MDGQTADKTETSQDSFLNLGSSKKIPKHLTDKKCLKDILKYGRYHYNDQLRLIRCVAYGMLYSARVGSSPVESTETYPEPTPDMIDKGTTLKLMQRDLNFSNPS